MMKFCMIALNICPTNSSTTEKEKANTAYNVVKSINFKVALVHVNSLGHNLYPINHSKIWTIVDVRTYVLCFYDINELHLIKKRKIVSLI